ncbi:MAG: STAS domain-containing protein, partial [Flavobacterium sp.]|nr:STAS domain-containing protein [Flavobacterium sp.]
GLQGFKVVGTIPAGLPSFHMPRFTVKDVEEVFPLAFACFLLSYIESVSAARTLAQKNGFKIDVHQELLALGIANAAVGLAQGYPVAGGLSQSAVNDTAGAKTPLSLVFASIAIALCLVFLTGMLQNLPMVILAAIVLVAISGLFDLKEMKHLFKVDKGEFAVAIIALFGVIFFGILKGVLLAALVTLLMIIRATSKPNVAFLGKIPNTHRYSDRARHPENENVPGVLIVRIESSILYFNTDNISDEIWAKINSETENIKLIIFDLNSSPFIDIAGVRFFKSLFLDLKAIGISLKIAEARSEVRDKLRSENMEELLGNITRFISVDDLVQEALNKEK